jgi:hypothetical protein
MSVSPKTVAKSMVKPVVRVNANSVEAKTGVDTATILWLLSLQLKKNA